MPHLAGMTTFWNPCGYQNIQKNMRDFRAHWPERVPLFILEMSFTGEWSLSDAMPHETLIKVQLNEDQVLWQKEAALNLLLREHIPASYDQVAWVDCDILFMNSHWPEETQVLLEEAPVCQPFSSVVLLDATGNPISRKEAAAQFSYRRLGEPGYAMACRREILEGGLPWQHCSGGADMWLWEAWCGRFNVMTADIYPARMRREYLADCKHHWDRVRGNVRCLRGDIAHLYHGRRDNRHYNERNLMLARHDFSPRSDVAIAANGLARWASESNKPLLHQEVAAYFHQRQEDDELRA